VAGAYKATPTRHLEAEMWVPPLDLYLNKWLADFEDRLQKPSLPTPQPFQPLAEPVTEPATRPATRPTRSYRPRPQGLPLPGQGSSNTHPTVNAEGAGKEWNTSLYGAANHRSQRPGRLQRYARRGTYTGHSTGGGTKRVGLQGR
jgi:hypothetical protein